MTTPTGRTVLVTGASSGFGALTVRALADASCAANMACGNSGLTLVHALSTAPSVHLPHGLQNGVLLPHVARFNAAISTPDVAALVAELDGLYARIGFEGRFPSGSVGEREVTAMITASSGHPFRANNARSTTDDELRGILTAAGATVAVKSPKS
jgi:alcohol dehydrogenase